MRIASFYPVIFLMQLLLSGAFLIHRCAVSTQGLLGLRLLARAPSSALKSFTASRCCRCAQPNVLMVHFCGLIFMNVKHSHNFL